jgi:nucleotide-binding universal stress UspA family protein
VALELTHASGPAGRRSVEVALQGHGAPLDAILRVARIVSTALGAQLHGLFVWRTPVAPGEVPRLLGLSPEALEGVVLDVEVGEPADRLIAMGNAHPDSFLVLGADGDVTENGTGLGELARRTLAASPTATIVVGHRATAPDRLTRILLPLDGTPSTARAIAPVGELAREAHASLDIVFVGSSGPSAPTSPAPDAPGTMRAPQYVDQAHHEWATFSEEFSHRFLRALGHVPPDVPTNMFVRAGDPATEILGTARELASNLIVLVWQGGLGAPADVRTLRDAPCPVLVLQH